MMASEYFESKVNMDTLFNSAGFLYILRRRSTKFHQSSIIVKFCVLFLKVNLPSEFNVA